ncbi:MAG: trehalose-phosphatase [Acidimicrobiales bacterium]|nr:trehalose-phosphatase [Acidimicrobiales bacterium]
MTVTSRDLLIRWVEPLRADPSSSVLLFDFDGTLSPTVPDPASARLADGAVNLLTDLVGVYRTVGVLSGRPLSFLTAHFPSGVVLSGQYGLEVRDADGTVRFEPGVSAEAIVAASDGLRVLGIDPSALEPKGLTLTVHYRRKPDQEPAIRAAAAEVAQRLGLVLHDAKQSIELRPPVAVDKGTVLDHLADGASAVLYVGDDLGDVPAFDALERLHTSGVATVGVAVDGPELPAEVRSRVDLVVDGVDGVVDLLGILASR